MREPSGSEKRQVKAGEKWVVMYFADYHLLCREVKDAVFQHGRSGSEQHPACRNMTFRTVLPSAG